jgi:methylmalonyl-CoA mutase C-terminal domain/subunit
MARRIRVLLAKLGLDAHTIGVTVIAQAMRDAGMEVVYTGLRQTPEMVVNAAIQEGVDVVGLSSLSAAHMKHVPVVVRQLRERGAAEILVVGGGVIPEEDAAELIEAGLDQIFTMGTDTRKIVQYIEQRVRERDESL